MAKRIIKFSLGLAGMVVLGMGILYVTKYYEDRGDPEQALIKEAEQLKQ